MFLVLAEYAMPLRTEIDDMLVNAAGRMWDGQLVDVAHHLRKIQWQSGDFTDAVGVRDRVRCVPGVKASFREK